MAVGIIQSMDWEAYRAIRFDPAGAGIGVLGRSWIRLTGRDRASFLNGQVSNDMLRLQPGMGVSACLLNNVGHMLADLYVHALPDELLVEAPPDRAAVVVQTLQRFAVRERVVIEDGMATTMALTVRGQGAALVIASTFGAGSLEQVASPGSNAAVDMLDGHMGVVAHRPTIGAGDTYDVIVSPEAAQSMSERLLTAPGARRFGDEIAEIVRIEDGVPAWGAELDESIIPLEANLYDSIDRNKGCYMGQEIIARILSRGHTNRTLVGFRMDSLVTAGASLLLDGAGVGRVTSAADSPQFGSIALGYVRNEYAHAGTALLADNGAHVTIATLPFESPG